MERKDNLSKMAKQRQHREFGWVLEPYTVFLIISLEISTKRSITTALL